MDEIHNVDQLEKPTMCKVFHTYSAKIGPSSDPTEQTCCLEIIYDCKKYGKLSPVDEHNLFHGILYGQKTFHSLHDKDNVKHERCEFHSGWYSGRFIFGGGGGRYDGCMSLEKSDHFGRKHTIIDGKITFRNGKCPQHKI